MVLDPKALRSVLVLATRYKPEGQEVARRLAGELRARGLRVEEELQGGGDICARTPGADLAVSVGGDGTILTTARRMGKCPIPTIGINTGKLGFLAEFSVGDLLGWLDGKADIRPVVVPRMLLECRVVRNGVSETRYALNDAVIHQGVMTRLITISMRVGDDYAIQYRADGLIVSTPVGSTAYSLSLGGPILTPGMQAFIVTPIAPHTLTNRPIVIEAVHELRFRILTPCEEAAVIFDGHERLDVTVGCEVTVRRAERDFPLIAHGRRSYYDLLRTKLGWGAPLNYSDAPLGAREP